MDPKIVPHSISEEDNILRFTLSGVNVSIANALRRVGIAEIDCVVFKTYNESVNQCTIHQNTSMFNNEIVKLRLGCIPIHIDDLEMPLENYLMEVSVENMTDTIQYVTTKDFKIKNITTNKYLTENDRQKVFPPSDVTGYYIDFLPLKQKISDQIPGEIINLECKFSIGNSKENGMFNATSCSTYRFTPDDAKIEMELNKMRKYWKDQGLNKDEIQFKEKDWRLLDGKREQYCKQNSFDFQIESAGVFSNQEIVKKACDVIIKKLNHTDSLILNEKLPVTSAASTSTLENCYNITLENEDYTLGKIIEFVHYSRFWVGEDAKLSYVGFCKEHPHDDYSTIRVAYENPVDVLTIYGDLQVCIKELIAVYEKIKNMI